MPNNAKVVEANCLTGLCFSLQEASKKLRIKPFGKGKLQIPLDKIKAIWHIGCGFCCGTHCRINDLTWNKATPPPAGA